MNTETATWKLAERLYNTFRNGTYLPLWHELGTEQKQGWYNVALESLDWHKPSEKMPEFSQKVEFIIKHRRGIDRIIGDCAANPLSGALKFWNGQELFDPDEVLCWRPATPLPDWLDQ